MSEKNISNVSRTLGYAECLRDVSMVLYSNSALTKKIVDAFEVLITTYQGRYPDESL
jgi:hypothetical protein